MHRSSLKQRIRAASVKLAAIVLLTAGSVTGHAEDDPIALLDQTLQSALSEFLATKDQMEQDSRQLTALLDRVIVPLFDFERIARLVLAKHYKTASQEERNAFSVEFKRLLIATYSSALFKYTGQQEVRFIDAEIKEKKQRQLATVRSELVLGDGSQPIPIDYFMIRSQGGESWKIYNLSVAGLNMVINYRGVFQSSILNKGLPETIKSMRESNNRLMAS